VTWPFGYNFELSLDANRLATGIRLANRQVWKRAEDGPEFAGMGTTVAAALIDGTHAAVANVGDSRVYLYRAGWLRQLTTDDTWLSAVVQRGMLDTTAIANHPMRNVLTQAAGSQYDVDVHTTDVKLEAGDMLLLSTDGLHTVVPDDDMRATLSSGLAAGRPVEDLAGMLIQAGRSAGAPDNLSCVLIKYDEP
jgi:protein phosphatase